MKAEGPSSGRRLAGLLRHVAEGERARIERAIAPRREIARDPEDERQIRRAAELGRLREHVQELPDVRAGVVAALRDEIALGAYRIDGARIADAMLEEEHVFHGRESDQDDDR